VRLTAVVPATDAPPTLDRCLAAIRAAGKPPEEVVVVERADGPGPAAARNEGAARAAGDVLVFVDADVVVHPDAFERLRVALADPTLAAVFGSYDDRPEAPGLVSRFRNLLHHHVHQEGAGLASTFWAGLGAVRRDAFEAAGGFDSERYPEASIEDVELGLRLTAAGRRIVLDPAVQGTHLKAWTLSGMLRTDLLRRGVPWVALLLGRRESSRALNLGWRHRLSALAAVGAASGVVARRPRRALAGASALVALNPRLYRLLARRLGPAGATASVALHAAHLLTAAAAVPLGVAEHLRITRARRGGGRPGARAARRARC
jgi:GT2 family glycosyltransferase